MQPTPPSRTYQRRAAVLLLLFVFIFNVAASTPSETPPPPGAPTPAQLRAGNWNDKPLDAPEEAQADTRSQTSEIEPASLICQDGENVGLNNLSSTIVYSIYERETGWDIRAGGPCSPYTHPALASSPATDYDPSISPDASRVAFVSDRSGNDDIYTINVDGTNLTQITNDPATDAMPAFAPLGRKIAFVSDRSGNPEIYSMMSDGSQLTRLTNHQGLAIYPDYSPDGSKIAYTLLVRNAGLIMVMNQDGSNAHALTNDFIPLLGRARWSPKGDRLAFEYDSNNDGWIDLGVIKADGSGYQLYREASPGLYEDLQVGSWSSNEQYFFYGGLYYFYFSSEGRWYLTRTRIHYDDFFRGGAKNPFLEYKDVMQPQVTNPDRQQPTTWIESNPQSLVIPPYPAKFTIVWGAFDPGPSGLYYADLRVSDRYNNGVRVDSQTCSEPSAKGKHSISCQTTYLSDSPGSVFNVRSQAVDYAGNSTPTRSVPELQIYVYKNKVGVQAWDAREMPLDQVTITANPQPVVETQPTQLDGRTTVYFTQAGPYQVSYFRPGTAVIPAQEWINQTDYSTQAVIPGKDEQVTNGYFTFANPLEAWQHEDMVNLTAADGREGGKSAQVRFNCGTASCLPDSELVTQAPAGEIASDSQGTIHVVAVDGAYFTRANDGTWTPGPRLPIARYTSLVITPEDELFIVSRLPQAAIYRKRPAEDWSTLALPAAVADPPTLLPGSQDRLHAVFTLTSAEGSRFFYYSYLHPDDSWTAPKLLSPTSIPDQLDIQPAMVEQNGVLYILYRSAEDQLKLTTVDANGSVGPETILNDPWTLPIDHPQIAASPDGTLHAISRQFVDSSYPGGMQRFDYLYYRRPAGGEWLEPCVLWSSPYSSTPLPTTDGWGTIGLDDRNNVHVLILDLKNATNNLVFLSSSNSGLNWKTISTFQPGDPLSADGIISGTQKHVVLGGPAGLVYRPLTFTTLAQSGGIWQEITLPPTMHLPTLSFFYQVDTLEENGPAAVEAMIEEVGQEPVSLLVKSGATEDWQHAWADLSPWLGKTVKLMLRLNQAAEEFPAALRLDEVSVASWTTPLLRAATPSRIDHIPAEGVWVRLEGGNLADGSKVYLGDKEIKTVRFDPQTGDLRIFLSSSTRLGVYDVRVVTAGGMEETLKAGLWIGQPLFAPIISTR